MNKNILLVDDDPNILASYRRTLRNHFDLTVAGGGAEALIALGAGKPFAAIVTDKNMPGMDGLQLLAAVKERHPDTIRLMLTGQADIQTAIAAVNEGSIFRFLTKPCDTDIMIKALDAAVEQHRLISSERELLEKTLSRSIKVLVDILAIVNPMAFGKASRLRRYARHIARELRLPRAWQYEFAAMLSQIGCVTLPQEIIERFYRGEALSGDEQNMLDSYPLAGREMLEKIPRLEEIAQMIGLQMKLFAEFHDQPDPKARPEINLGAQILNVAMEFDRYLTQGMSPATALAAITANPRGCDPALAALLSSYQRGIKDKVIINVKLKNITVGMTIGENIVGRNNYLLVGKGQEITYALIERLRNFWRNGLINDEIAILSDKPEAK